MNNILVDTCFWYALYDKSDQHYDKAQKIKDYLELGNIIIPYPVMYETLNTYFVKKWINGFKEIINKSTTILVSDEPYKNQALKNTLLLSSSRPMSLVDMVLRFMMEDVDLNINALITFNVRDFVDLCEYRRIELISQ